MTALILGAGIARTIPEEPRQRVARARGQNATQYIDTFLFLHNGILQTFRNLAEHFDVKIIHAGFTK